MKNILFLMFVTVSIGCQQKKSITGISLTGKDVNIEFASPSINKPVPISCSLFDKAFPKTQTISITEKSEEYVILDSLFKKFVLDSLIDGIDARIKISFEMDTMCLDIFGNYYSKSRNAYMRNDSLSVLVYKKTGYDYFQRR